MHDLFGIDIGNNLKINIVLLLLVLILTVDSVINMESLQKVMKLR